MLLNRNVFTVNFNSVLPHNTLLIKPKIDTKIVSIYTINTDAERIELLVNPIEIDSNTSIRYETIFSGKIWIEVEGTYVDELSIDDILIAEVSLAKYFTMGRYRSEEGQISFHKYISPIWEIDNVKDVLVDGELGIRTLDRYKNVIYDDTIPISLNDDGYLVEYANNGTEVPLPIEPLMESVKVLVEGNYTDEFEVIGNKIILDIPNNTDCYIIYKPIFLDSGSFMEISENVWINSNGEIKLREDNCDTILFTYTVKLYNTDLTSTNHTPIIKSLGIVSSSK